MGIKAIKRLIVIVLISMSACTSYVEDPNIEKLLSKAHYETLKTTEGYFHQYLSENYGEINQKDRVKAFLTEVNQNQGPKEINPELCQKVMNEIENSGWRKEIWQR